MNRSSLVAVVAVFAACSNEQDPSEGLFSLSVNEVVLEIDYQKGAAPFTKDATTGNPWTLFQANAEALFSGAPRTVSVPNQLSEMELIDSPEPAGYSTAAILDLADTYRNETSTNARRAFYVVFLDGYFVEDGQIQDKVLGVSVTGTGIIAIFKPVVDGSARQSSVRSFVEQSTLIHEFGHTVGLVDNGLPLTSDHHDQAHGAHCTNPDCVMYYLNEGAADLYQFAKGLHDALERGGITTEDLVLFGPECIADAVAARSR